jgi:hypothetical protein
MVASDKLFYWLFQNQPDRILSLLPDLPPDARGYSVSDLVLKERVPRQPPWPNALHQLVVTSFN